MDVNMKKNCKNSRRASSGRLSKKESKINNTKKEMTYYNKLNDS